MDRSRGAAGAGALGLVTGATGDIGLLLFRPYESFLFAVDLLGYAMMCVACLCAAFAVARNERALRLAPLSMAR
ncbi:hypothetical protein [Sphingomonas mesophila]|uniref:hypothetical protein n=1 Tax=Sphingomonas mesophila TaxID=2303576 RepID=UPI0013C2F4E3|nr:hypothetical protein [Sphingomonas mesophila]